MPKKSGKKVRVKKNKTIAETFIETFKLIKDKEFIRFKDAPSHLLLTMRLETENLLRSKYGGEPVESPQMVHRASFMRNPLRYIFQMIDQSEVSEKTKKSRRMIVDKVIKQAMIDDPLTTVKTIVYSLARVVRF